MTPESKNGAYPAANEERGIRPKYRRSFGCVTWTYMATLAFLAVSSLLLMPMWIFGNWNVFSLLEGYAFFALLLFLPAIAGAAVLGARTYRSERKVAARNGTYIGTVVGWLGYTSIVWLDVDESGRNLLVLAFVPLAVVAAALIVYALFSSDNGRARKAVIVASALALVAGVLVLILDGSSLVLLGAIIAAVAGAAAGWTAGIGYARAGGAEMLPPGVVEKPRRAR